MELQSAPTATESQAQNPNNMKQRIQLGIEGYKNGERVFRMTPLDMGAEVKPEIAVLAGMVEQVIDARDAQPGDGEIDFPLGLEQAAKMFPIAKPFLSRVDKCFAFVNLKSF